MSHNEFGHNGTESLSRLLKSIAQKNGGNLKQLKLGDCRLDMKQIVPFLGALLHLELLNVSGNVFGTGNVGGFLSVLRERSAPLSTLNVSGCSLSPDEVLFFFLKKLYSLYSLSLSSPMLFFLFQKKLANHNNNKNLIGKRDHTRIPFSTSFTNITKSIQSQHRKESAFLSSLSFCSSRRGMLEAGNS